MVLRNEEQWKSFLVDAGIPSAACNNYATTFAENCQTEADLPDLMKDYLQDLGINVIGDILAVIHHAKTHTSSMTDALLTPAHVSFSELVKAVLPKSPQAISDMTNQQFQESVIDGDVFKRLARIPTSQIPIQLYNLCDDTVQNNIINTNSEFSTLAESDMLKLIEIIVTSCSNPTVHRMTFANITQSEGESIQNYLIGLKSTAKDCGHTCPNCNADLRHLHIKVQFIMGLHKETLQADILAKACLGGPNSIMR